tara:strand:+ start:77695 stop:79173 length:1479 start_codon:yes stop_codon:yes gene_type:complete
MNIKARKILFINPGGKQETYQELNRTLTAKEPPLWALLFAAYVRKFEVDTKVIDSNILNLNEEEVSVLAKEYQPSLICIPVYGHNPSASTQTMPAVRKLLESLKAQGLEEILLIGTHPAALPERTLREEKIKYVCTGEGFVTLYDFIHEEQLSNIRGIAFLKEDKYLRTLPAPLLDNLDENIPVPAWDLVPIEKYRCHNWHGFGGLDRSPYVSILTTLGCPYHCSFCNIQAPFREGEALNKNENNSYRYWSPAVIGEQLEELSSKYKITNIKFMDEMFVLNKTHVIGICDEIIKRELKLNIWAYSRVDTVSDEVAKKLYKAGIRWICLGIETPNEDIAVGISKKTNSEKIEKAIEVLKNNNINIIGNFIFGLPDDNMERLESTLNFSKKLKLDYVNFYCAMALPGSQLYQENIDRKEDWEKYGQLGFSTEPMATKDLSAAQILNFRDKAFHDFFKDPQYQNYVREKFGQHSLDEIREMIKIPLKRKITSSEN